MNIKIYFFKLKYNESIKLKYDTSQLSTEVYLNMQWKTSP